MNQQSPDSGQRGQATVAWRPDPGGVFTGEWASALGSPGMAGILRPLAEGLLAIARDAPFRPQRAAEIGAALVAANLIGADALGCSLTVIGRHLGRAWGIEEQTPASAVQEAVAAGYVRALVAYHSRHDPLTGLANRTLFLDRLAAAVADHAGPAGPPRGSDSAISTSTASSRSTTPWATTSGTGCSSRSRGGSNTGSRDSRGRPRRSPGSGETRSCCSSRIPAEPTSWWPWPARS